MCKPARKSLVAALTVVVSMVASHYFFPEHWAKARDWVGETFVSMFSKQEAPESIPPEKKIAAARLRLDELAREDDRAFQKVAEQIVKVQNLENEVKAGREKLAKEESRIAARSASLDKADKFVVHQGERYETKQFRDELRAAAARFQTEEQMLQSKEEQLNLCKKNLEISRKQLSDRKLTRQKMRTELERLETALAAARQAQAAEQNTLDDSGYEEVRKEIDAICNTMEVMKQKQILKTEIDGPVHDVEQRKEQEEAIDRYLKERFNGEKK